MHATLVFNIITPTKEDYDFGCASLFECLFVGLFVCEQDYLQCDKQI